MKKILLVSLVLLFPLSLFAKKTTYVATDHRFNYVKRSEIPLRLAEARAMSHPSEVDEEEIRSALLSVRAAKRHLLSKEIDRPEIFSEPALDFLSRHLTQGFREASVTEELEFSYLSKQPDIIIRNDRLTIGTAWMNGRALHVQFKKLFAKVTGDVDRRGTEDRAISRSRGTRILLEVGPCQKLGIDDPNEVVIDLECDPALAADEDTDESALAEKPKKKKRAPEEKVATPEDARSVKERLEALEELKKSKLISKKEYKQKRKEIMSDL